MTTRYEQAFLYWYAKNKYSGFGEWVDLGCWLGSSAISAAMGIRKNKNVGKKDRIFVFDRWRWMSRWNKFCTGTKYQYAKDGEDFKKYFLEETMKYKDMIVVCEDVLKSEWCGKPIEFIHNDASKGINECKAIFDKFLPYLISGGVYIEQDFFHGKNRGIAPWIYENLSKHPELKPIGRIFRSSSMVFKKV